MRMFLKSCFPVIFYLVSLIGLGGCLATTTQSVSSTQNVVGPVASNQFGQTTQNTRKAPTSISDLQLEVAVLPFDPNIPDDPAELEKFRIWPELRRAESVRFALMLQSSLQNTGAFGAIRVVPGTQTTADLYIHGAIIKSNGEDVAIKILCKDISNRKWCSESFEHRVSEAFFRNLRNKGKDSYEPVFVEAADYIVRKLKKRDPSLLGSLPELKEIRFANSLSTETFGRYLTDENNYIQLTALPAETDPMLSRVRSIRVHDQLFVDRLQVHYQDFNDKMDDSYRVWQEQSLQDTKAEREARNKAQMRKFLGGVLIGLAALGAANADTSESAVASATALAGGLYALNSGFQYSNEARVHREALNELGSSIDVTLAPQVVNFENESTELFGDAQLQYEQWIGFLRKMYELEATPQVQI